MHTRPVFNTFLFLGVVLSPALAEVCSGQPQEEAATSRHASSALRDIQLEDGGRMSLHVVTKTGRNLPGQLVMVAFQDNTICRTRTDGNGRVTISGLRSGLHSLVVADRTYLYRFWNDAAPPSAVSNPAVVLEEQVVRGQYAQPMMGPPMMPVMAPAALATGVTATALAAVLFGKNSRSNKSFVAPASP